MKTRNIPFSPPDMTDAEANEVRDAIMSGWITTGPRTKMLERLISEYLNVRKTVCLNSQTACAETALRILGIGPGDEIIVPAYTYSASASVISHIGAKIIFVDIQEDTPHIDYGKLSLAITEHTKAIIPVDLAGIPCDYAKLFQIVNEKKSLFLPSNDIQSKVGRIAICCDAAHAFGAQWHEKMVGSIADFSSFSFHAVKNLTTAEGGALSWNLPFGEEIITRQQYYYGYPVPYIEGETWNNFIYRLSQLFSLHGQNKDAFSKSKLCSWEYDIIGPWYKCNMTDIAAAMGIIQLRRYPELLIKRKMMIERMDDAFSSLPVKTLCHYSSDYKSSGHLYMVRLTGKNREETNKIIQRMAEKGIACNVHYKPLPMMTAFKAMGFSIDDFTNAASFFENEISLPLNTRMTEDDLEYIISTFRDIINNTIS